MRPEPLISLAERTLGGVRLFCSVETDTVLALGERARWRSVRSGYAVVRKGDVSTSFYVLVRGSASLHHGSCRVPEPIEEGEVMGLRLAFCSRPAAIHAVTTSSALIAEISRGDLLAAMADSPALAHNVALFLSGRGDRDQTRDQLDARVAAALVRAAASPTPTGGFVPLTAPVQIPVWATLLGVDTIDVCRSLKRLEGAGLIRSQGERRVRVDLAGLKRRLG